jgi:hypothetical protein
MLEKTSFLLLSFPRNKKTLHSQILPSTHQKMSLKIGRKQEESRKIF